MSTRMTFVAAAVAVVAIATLGCEDEWPSARFAAGEKAKPARHVRRQPELRPVFDQDFPDPSVVRSPDGWYYAYATQTVVTAPQPHIVNIQIARSRDLLAWTFVGDALPKRPKWARRTRKFWAPDVVYDNGRYYMYYVAEPDSRDGLCLAVATAKRAAGPFRDSGRPLRCGSGFSEIDPMHFDDPATGKKFLYWGSGFLPIRVQELAADRMGFAPGSEPIPLVSPHPNGAPDDHMTMIEGAWVMKRGEYYYLFFSGNSCCEPDPNYAVMVARSLSATGPFELLRDQPGNADSVIVGSDAAIIAPGHNAVIEGPDGRPWLLFHGIEKKNMYLKYPIAGDRKVRRVLFAQPFEFREGWPVLDP